MWTSRTTYDVRGRWWRHGSWRFDTDVETGAGVAGAAEWCLELKRNALGFELGRNGEGSDVGLDLDAPFVGSLFLRLRAPWLKWARVENSHEARHTGIKFGWSGRWVHVLIDKPNKSGWNRDHPWWREISLSPRKVWGKRSTDKTVEGTGDTVVPMPEGCYPATWELTSLERAHVRWPGTWRDRIKPIPDPPASYSLNIPGGIPSQGGDTDSYGYRMDGTFNVIGPFRTLEQAVGAAVGGVLRNRRKYGGPHDLPKPMSVAEAGEWVRR